MRRKHSYQLSNGVSLQAFWIKWCSTLSVQACSCIWGPYVSFYTQAPKQPSRPQDPFWYWNLCSVTFHVRSESGSKASRLRRFCSILIRSLARFIENVATIYWIWRLMSHQHPKLYALDRRRCRCFSGHLFSRNRSKEEGCSIDILSGECQRAPGLNFSKQSVCGRYKIGQEVPLICRVMPFLSCYHFPPTIYPWRRKSLYEVWHLLLCYQYRGKIVIFNSSEK